MFKPKGFILFVDRGTPWTKSWERWLKKYGDSVAVKTERDAWTISMGSDEKANRRLLRRMAYLWYARDPGFRQAELNYRRIMREGTHRVITVPLQNYLVSGVLIGVMIDRAFRRWMREHEIVEVKSKKALQAIWKKNLHRKKPIRYWIHLGDLWDLASDDAHTDVANVLAEFILNTYWKKSTVPVWDNR